MKNYSNDGKSKSLGFLRGFLGGVAAVVLLNLIVPNHQTQAIVLIVAGFLTILYYIFKKAPSKEQKYANWSMAAIVLGATIIVAVIGFTY